MNRWLNQNSLWLLYRLKGGEIIRREIRDLPNSPSVGYRPAFVDDDNRPTESFIILWDGNMEGEASHNDVACHVEHGAVNERAMGEEIVLSLTSKGDRIITYAPDIRAFRAAVDAVYPSLDQDVRRIERCFALVVEAIITQTILRDPMVLFRFLLEETE